MDAQIRHEDAQPVLRTAQTLGRMSVRDGHCPECVSGFDEVTAARDRVEWQCQKGHNGVVAR